VPLPSGEFGHVRRDRLFPERPGDRDPVLAVGDVVATLQPVGLNGCQRLSLAKRDHQCLKAPAAPLIGGEKVTVELTVCGAPAVPTMSRMGIWSSLALHGPPRMVVSFMIGRSSRCGCPHSTAAHDGAGAVPR
jgi:hypothetical protein